MATQWYYRHGGKRLGPLSTRTLLSLARVGEVKVSGFLWKNGLPKWVPASNAKKLFSQKRKTVPRRPVASSFQFPLLKLEEIPSAQFTVENRECSLLVCSCCGNPLRLELGSRCSNCEEL